jgi:hypothetical protein
VTIARAGGIAPLVELTHIGSAGAQEKAAGALKNLAVNGDNRVAIAQAGGIAPLVELTCSASAGSKEQAAGALKNLALNADNSVAIAQAGGIAPLVELTRSASAYAKQDAVEALRNLAANADNRVAIAQAGGIAPLVELTRSGDAYAKQYAAEALWVLAANADNKVAMKVAGYHLPLLPPAWKFTPGILGSIWILLGFVIILLPLANGVVAGGEHKGSIVAAPLLPIGHARSDAAAAEEDDAQDRGGKGERITVAAAMADHGLSLDEIRNAMRHRGTTTLEDEPEDLLRKANESRCA